MNTKVKVGIAMVIVAALVALIVLDQKAGTPDPSKGTADDPAPAASPDERAQRTRKAEIDTIIHQFPNANVTPPPEKIKDTERANPGKEIQPLKDDEYVIQERDTYETIAEKKYGSRSFWTHIAQANPGMKASALRPGKAIKVPPKPDRKVEETAKTPAPVLVDPVALTPGGPKVYTVQAGDTLTGISQKVYSTARHWEKIFDANRDKIGDAHTLTVGAKLVMPDLPVAKAGPATAGGTVQTSVPAAPPPGAKVHAVQTGESLWKIAEKYSGDRGILETIQAILRANADKLKDEKSFIRVGWSLVIPD